MATDQQTETVAEKWLRSLKNRRSVAALVLIGTGLAALASLTDSLDKIHRFAADTLGRSDRGKKTADDSRLEKEILGAWAFDVNKASVTGTDVKGIEFTYFGDGTFQISGSYSISDKTASISLPISVSGNWNVNGSALYWTVTSSNIPLYIKDGFHSVTKIISVTADKLVYVDPSDRKTKTLRRIGD